MDCILPFIPIAITCLTTFRTSLTQKMVTRYFKVLIALSIISFGTTGICFAGQIDFSIKGGYFNYREPYLDISISGLVSGLQGSYKKTFSACSFKIQSEFVNGNLTYDGYLNDHQISDGSTCITFSDPSPLRFSSNLWYSDSVLLVGKSFIKRTYSVTPYAGLGFRYLNNPKNQDIRSDYSREITYLYLPMVVEFQKSISKKSFWGITGEVDILIAGSVEARLSDVSEKYNDLKFHQSLGGSVKLAGIYMHEISGYVISVKPFLDMWVVDDSDTDVLKYNGSRVITKYSDGNYRDYCEPANITLTAGLQFNIRF